METETIEAVYEHGGFRLITPLDAHFAEGQKVRLVVEPIENRTIYLHWQLRFMRISATIRSIPLTNILDDVRTSSEKGRPHDGTVTGFA